MARFISCAQDIIWGAGATEDAALSEAIRYGGEDIESLDTVPATDRLFAAVQGFTDGHPIYLEDIRWEIRQGVADLSA
ncbi:MAG: hypothetical protein WCO00_11610 [Rhodospirillaceae bacterium]